MKIKICGITNLADARYVSAAGADYLGFIQFPESPRFIESHLAKEIIDWIFGPKSVGVFVDVPADEINRISEKAGFELVQLHGSETVELCQEVERPIIKAFRIREGATADQLRTQMLPFTRTVDYFLLDAFDASLSGGTGKQVDWDLAHRLAEEFPLFIAGGINPENALDATEIVRPFGLDVSSGLEIEPGRKDFSKIDAFFSALDQSETQGEEL